MQRHNVSPGEIKAGAIMQSDPTQPKRPTVGASVVRGGDAAIVKSVADDGMTVDLAVYPRQQPPFFAYGVDYGCGASGWCWPSEA